MITLIDADIFTTDTKYLCHQCNAVTTHAAHMALTVFTKYPWADIYTPRSRNIRKVCDNTLSVFPEDTPGNIVIRGNGTDQRYVINMIGQMFPGFPKFPDSKKDGYTARQEYFKQCLAKISKIENLGSIAFPWQIGCGAAGGNWDIYQKMIENFSGTVNAKVFIYRLPELSPVAKINTDAAF